MPSYSGKLLTPNFIQESTELLKLSLSACKNFAIHWKFTVFSFYISSNLPKCLTVKVKWGKESFPDVEVNTDEEPLLFKAQLFALTGVQPERQKIMCKGTTLKDGDEWNLALKNVSVIDEICDFILCFQNNLDFSPPDSSQCLSSLIESNFLIFLGLGPLASRNTRRNHFGAARKAKVYRGHE